MHKERVTYNALKAREIRKAVIELLGGRCIHCGFSDIRALQIDHVHGGGRNKAISSTALYKEVIQSTLKKEGKYQLLCANCNQIKKSVMNENPFKRW